MAGKPKIASKRSPAGRKKPDLFLSAQHFALLPPDSFPCKQSPVATSASTRNDHVPLVPTFCFASTRKVYICSLKFCNYLCFLCPVCKSPNIYFSVQVGNSSSEKIIKNMQPSPFPTPHNRLISCSRRRTAAAVAAASFQSLHSPFPNSELKEYHDEDPDTKSQSIANRSYWTKKIHSLSSTPGHIDAALRLIDCLRLRGFRPDSHNLSSIIHGLCAAGRSDEAHRRLLFSFTYAIIPDDRTSNVLLARLLDASTPRLTLSVLRQLLVAKPAFVPSLTNYNRLSDQLCSLSVPFEAHSLVRDMIARGRYPNTVTYTVLIDGFGRAGLLDDARRVFDEMSQRMIQPNSLTFSVFIRWLMRKKYVTEGKEMMERLWMRMQQEEDRSINSAAFANLIDSLCVEGFFHEVFRIAEEMPQKNWVCEEFSYGQMVDSLCKSGKHHGASRIIYIMRKRGFVPSFLSYNSIVHGLSNKRGSMRAYQLFKEGIEFGYSPPEPTYKVLVESLCKEKDLYKAKDVAEFMIKIEGIDKIRIYNIFLSALRLADNPSEQLNMLVSMLQKQCHPDVVTLNTVIHGFCKIGRVNEAMKILDDMMEGKFCSPDVVTFTTTIYGLIDVGRIEEALYFMHKKMAEHNCAPNIVTYNAILRGLFKLGKVDKSMEIFHEMAGKGLQADCVTHTVVIEGLCEASQLEQAKKFWDEIVWPSNMHDDYVYAAIMRGLCRLGKMDVACDFLYELVDCGVSPGAVNYNILIDSACKQGMKKQAYQIVGEMRKNGLKLDSVTWRILNKLHERESANLPNTDLEVNGTGDEVSSMEKELIIDEKNDGGLGDQLEGLVDHSFSFEVIQDDEIDGGFSSPVKTSLRDSINEIMVIGKRKKEPLSKVARRVFGLL